MANPDLALKLSKLKEEAASESTPQHRLEELANMSTEIARIVAANAIASPKLLRYLSLSSDKVTRYSVAVNPNTPTNILLKLGAQFPQQSALDCTRSH